MNVPSSLVRAVIKHVLLITHFLPPTHTAGTEQYTLGLAKALQARGYDVRIVCAEDWDSGKRYWNGVTEDNLEGIPVYRIHLNWQKARNPNRVLYDSGLVESWLDRFLHENKFDLVHVTSVYSLGVGVLRSVKRAKIPLILTLTDFWFLCPSLQLLRSDGTLCDGNTTAWQCEACLMAESNLFQQVSKFSVPEIVTSRVWETLAHLPPLTRQPGLRGMLLDMDDRKRAMRETFSLPDLVVSPSRTVKSIFAQNTSRPVILMPHGHDLTWLNEYQGKTKSDVLRFGYLGGLHEVKGVHLLIEAFIKADFGKQARLHIWGTHGKNEAYAKKLTSMIAGNDSISLHGKYSRRDLASILSEIDVALAPSIWYENAPLVIQEAFATKTPVIATNLGGMAEVIHHDVNGLLFERNDTADLARQMRRIVDQPGLLKKLSDGTPLVRSFNEEMNELEEIYGQLAKANLPMAPVKASQ